jgi:hypothetical protein
MVKGRLPLSGEVPELPAMAAMLVVEFAAG